MDTHNLKIILVDGSGNIIFDDEFLEEIKNTLCQLNTKKILLSQPELVIYWLNLLKKNFKINILI